MVKAKSSVPVKVLIDEQALQNRISELAAAIDRDYAESGAWLHRVLKGSVFSSRSAEG